MRTSLALAFLLAATTTCSVHAQEPERRATWLALRRADGAVWAGATVHLISRVIGPHHELPFADQVVVTSDARGRARAALLPGRPYSAWAHDTPDEERRYHVSNVLEGVIAGDTSRLSALPSRQRQYEIELRGLAPWRELADLHLRVLSPALQNRWLQDVDFEGDTLLLPPCPGPWLFLQFVSAHREIRTFWQELVPVDVWTEQNARTTRQLLGVDVPPPAEEGTARYRITLAPPRRFTLRVTGKENAPVAGARIFRDVTEGRGPWQELTETDASGLATLWLPGLPAGEEAFFCPGVELLARADGLADNLLLHHRLQQPGDPVTISLADGHAPRLELVWKDDEALPHEELLIYTSIQRGRQGGGQVGAGPFRFRTDDQGRAVLTGRAQNYTAMLVLVPSPALHARFPHGEDGSAPLIPIATWKAKDAANKRVELASFVPVDLELTRADGLPVRDGWLWLGNAEHGSSAPHYSLRHRLSRTGTLRLFLPPGSKWVFCAMGARSIGAHDLVVPKSETSLRLRISLEGSRLLSGRVLDPNGEPHPFAPIWPGRLRFQSGLSPDLLHNWSTLMMLATGSLRGSLTPPKNYFPNLVFRTSMWRWHAIADPFAQTDARGRFSLPVPESLQVRLHAAPRPGTDFAEFPDFELAPGTPPPPEVLLRLGQKD